MAGVALEKREAKTMGFMKNQKADNIAAEARRALEEGRRIFVAKLNMPGTHHGMSGSVPGWAEMIESVEDCGWQLVECSAVPDAKARSDVVVVFRRRMPAPPA